MCFSLEFTCVVLEDFKTKAGNACLVGMGDAQLSVEVIANLIHI
jgi:hypothetical protein